MIRRFFYLRALRLSLLLGALWDLLLAAALVLAPLALARTLGVPPPGESVYLAIVAVLATMLALLYLEAARDPRRYSAVVVVAAAGRLLLAALLGLAAWRAPHLRGLGVPAAVSALLGLAHLVFYLPQRR